MNIHITGTVQGVGFRPFVYRLAKRNLLAGWVLNAPDGVHAHVEGDGSLVASFLDELELEAPPAAHIASIDVEEARIERFATFEIRESEQGDSEQAKTEQPGASKRTRISADLATCPDCLAELFDPSDRRFHYPFVNCTNCGPRFTIIQGLPYDRPKTSMREFEMCPQCASEYADPMDRRFHAQPDACFECGPRLSLHIAGEEYVSATRASGAQGGVSGEARSDAPVDVLVDAPNVDAQRQRSDEILQIVASMLRDGKIVAVKGLGGYHLACDATNEQAVATLRERKRRYGKPLAIMVRNVEQAQRYCNVGEIEKGLLESAAAPIVLLERLGSVEVCAGGGGCSDPIAPSVAGNLHELGVVLPYTPVQHLLMSMVGFPLVMTSGNFTEEPIVSDNASAHRMLEGVADAFLDNDRQIVSRYDDSVLRVVNGRVQPVRRARGYAPSPVPFPFFGSGDCGMGMGGTSNETQAAPAVPPAASAPIFAVGPQQKNTFALLASAGLSDTPGVETNVTGTSTSEALVSQHIGDLDNAETMDSWLATLELYERIFDVSPTTIACDMHPEYISSKWAHANTANPVEVQHHHAHIAAVLAENIAHGNIGHGEKVIGIALDGTGYGTDGTIWGGEVLVCDCAEFERTARLQAMAIPGGEQAIRHPSRLAYSLLARDGLLGHPGAAPLLAAISGEQRTILQQMIDRGINCVQTSSAGRFLDAMGALLGICTDASFDGEAPMLLEAAAYDPASGSLVEDACDAWGDIWGEVGREAGRDAGRDAPAELPTAPIVKAALDDLVAGVPVSAISLRIHRALAALVVRACIEVRDDAGNVSRNGNSDSVADSASVGRDGDTGAGSHPAPLNTVALSGGVFMNRILLQTTLAQLKAAGFKVLLPIELPPNDGCISYGQLAVAMARAL